MKLPPTLTNNWVFRIWEGGCQSHFAGGFLDFWTASSRYGFGLVGDEGWAWEGVEVRVKPPAFGRVRIRTSSHWPGWNWGVLDGVVDLDLDFWR